MTSSHHSLPRGTSALVGVAAAVVVSAAMLGGCSSPDRIGHAGPTKICGTTVSMAASGPMVWHLPAEPAIPPLSTDYSGMDPTIVTVGDCTHGRTVTFEPSSAVTIKKVIKADDGLAAGLLISVPQPGTVIVVVHQGNQPPSRTTLDYQNFAR